MKVLLLAALAFVAVSAEDSQVLQNFVTGEGQFTAKVYKEMLKSNSGNFLVCPLSADIILALVHAGAKGETAQQIAQGLHLPENKEEIEQIFREVIPHLKSTSDDYSLSSANKVYLKDGFDIAEPFKKTAVDVFNAEVQTIDFSKTEQAANEINKWVEENTQDKIKNLIASKDLNGPVAAVLINALYFQGKWAKPFAVKSTQKRAFHLNSKEQVETDLMQQTQSFKYLENAELKAKFLQLNYKGNEVSMTIILPDDVEGLSALEDRLADVLATPILDSRRIHVVLPRFKTETKIDLKPVLEALGVVNAFQNSADFTGIGSHKEHLQITKVVQKTFIEVDEYGTTAAAATAVTAGLGGPLGRPVDFIADRPFIYCLRSPAGILFVGRYIKP